MPARNASTRLAGSAATRAWPTSCADAAPPVASGPSTSRNDGPARPGPSKGELALPGRSTGEPTEGGLILVMPWSKLSTAGAAPQPGPAAPLLRADLVTAC